MKSRIKIMGIVNITPDSFYDGGEYFDTGKATRHAEQLISDGADIVDIGGESTRPGAVPVSAQQEIDRICPVIEHVAKNSSIPISIDTYKSTVAEAAIRAGATMVNDISGLTFDENMIPVISRHETDVVIMHIQGTPQNMQKAPVYSSLVSDISAFLEASATKATANGIEPEKIILDPGIGFGKTLEDNYRIINNISEFKKIGFPVLIGLSRKSLIGNLYKNKSQLTPETVDRLPGTIALNIVSILNGADIIRVHDVKEHRRAMDSLEMLQKVS